MRASHRATIHRKSNGRVCRWRWYYASRITPRCRRRRLAQWLPSSPHIENPMPSTAAGTTRMIRLQDWATGQVTHRVAGACVEAGDATIVPATGERLESLVWMILGDDYAIVRDARLELECAVRAFAASFRDHGIVVEQMIVALKWATAMRRWRGRFDNGERLYDEIVLWS